MFGMITLVTLIGVCVFSGLLGMALIVLVLSNWEDFG